MIIKGWQHMPQECNGNYHFNGAFYVTRSVYEQLSASEVLSLAGYVKALAKSKGGLDYLQVFTNANGEKLYLIDQLSKDMIDSGGYSKNDNYCTLLWAHEY